MSQYEELKQFIWELACASEMKSYESLKFAESIGGFNAVFSRLAHGTNDPGVHKVYSSFLNAQKELCNAAKALTLAAQAGYDWCGDSSVYTLKKVKR